MKRLALPPEFHCGIHDYATTNIVDWNRHMAMTQTPHFENMATECIRCGRPIKEDVPYIPYTRPDPRRFPHYYTKVIALKCGNCRKGNRTKKRL